MIFLPLIAGFGASLGWACGIVLAQAPARALGAFAFTRLQLVACALILFCLVSAFGRWSNVAWEHWPAFLISSIFGVVLGNLAMIGCLRRGGPRRTELLLCLKAPLIAFMAFIWLGEIPSLMDISGAIVVLAGVALAIAWGGDATSDSDALQGGLLPVLGLGILAVGFQGLGFLVVKPALQAGTSPLAVSAIRLGGAAVMILVASFAYAPWMHASTPMTPKLAFQTILPGIIGYIVASSLLLFAIAHLEAGVAVITASLSPILVLPIIWMKDGQAPNKWACLGAATAVFGIGIIVLG